MQLENRPRKKQLPSKAYHERRHGVCGLCPAGCGLTLFLDKDNPVDLFGDEFHSVNKGTLCPKALALYGQIYDSRRLPMPGIRYSPREPWRLVDWDTALKFTADRLTAIPLEKTVIAGHESDPFDFICGADWAADSFGLPFRPGNFFAQPFGRAGSLSRILGISAEHLLCNTPRDWCASEAILLVGGDLAAEAPITFGPLLDARDRGKKLLYLGSRGGLTARRASHTFIVRPGSEGLALAGVAHVLLQQKMIAAEFLTDFASGLDALRHRLNPYSPSSVAPLCGLEVAALEELAAMLGKAFSFQVIAGQLEQRRWLDDAVLGLAFTLVTLKGCLGRPGGGLNLLASSPFVWEGHETPTALEQVLSSGGAFMAFGDPLNRLAGQAAREALASQSLLIHVGSFDNATRRLAHVSLPTAHWSEYPCLVHRTDGRALQWRSTLLPPYGEALPPLEIWLRLMRLLKPEAKAPWADSPEAATYQHCLADWKLASSEHTAGLRAADLLLDDNLDEGQATGGILWPCPAEDGQQVKVFENTRYIQGNVRGRDNILFAPYSYEGNNTLRFPTADGKIHLEEVVLPPLDRIAPQDGLLLAVGGLVDHASDHPQDWLWPHGCRGNAARFHANTAARLGIDNGEKIRLSSEFGSVTTQAAIMPDIPENVAALPPEMALALVAGTTVLSPVSLRVEVQC